MKDFSASASQKIMLWHWFTSVEGDAASQFFNVIIYFYICMENSNGKTKEILFMLESEGGVEIAREYTSFNYAEHITVTVIGVGIIFGIAFLIKALFNTRVTR
jgi:hypothetical protein